MLSTHTEHGLTADVMVMEYDALNLKDNYVFVSSDSHFIIICRARYRITRKYKQLILCLFVCQGLLPALGGLITADGIMVNACLGFSEKTPLVGDCYSQMRQRSHVDSKWTPDVAPAAETREILLVWMFYE